MKTIMKKIISILFCIGIIFSAVSTVSAADTALPARYSSADLGYIRPAENQYDSACCWAFTTLGVLSAYSIKHGIHEFDEADYSEAHLAWFNGKSRTNNPDDPMYGDGMDSELPYEEGARIFTSTFALAKGSGIEWEMSYPFKRTNSQMGNYFEEARYEHSAGILTEAILLRTTEDIKEAVIEYGAVEAGMHYDEAKLFNTAKRKYVNGEYIVTGNCCYLNAENTGEGHNIMIIGWDDNYPKSNFSPDNMPKRGGAWLCKSSWGTAWGENGLFWISYENAAFENVMTYACVDGNTYSNIYQYDGYGFNRRLSSSVSRNSATSANVYHSKSTLTLEAVGYYTYQSPSDAKCKINIDIYKNLPQDYDSPVYGEPAISFSVSETYDGYHTAELPCSIAINEGEIFSVVVSTATESGNASVLLEGNPVQSVTYEAAERCSYISFSGNKSGFTDTAKKYGGNVCIKAYTNEYQPGTVSGLRILSEDKTITKGTKYKESAGIMPMGQSGKVLWSSSDNNVITVDSNGNINAVGTGKAYLTASCSGKSDRILITVLPEYYSTNDVIIERNPGEKTVDYGDTLVLNASLSEDDTGVIFGWYVNGIKQSERSDTFSLVNITEPAEILVRLEDKNGNTLKNDSDDPIEASEKVKVKTGFFKKLISFLKNLFNADRRKYN